MRRFVTLSIAGLLVFLVFIVARYPARWAAPALPAHVQCQRLTGTIWSGRCAALTVEGMSLGDVRWNIRPARLLAGRLAAAAVVAKPGLDVRGEFETGVTGEVTARDVKVVVALTPSVLPQLPPNVRGTVRADLATFALSGRAITRVEGRLEAFELAQAGPARSLALGDYVLTFPAGAPGADPVGTLEDLRRGPLDVAGTLRLTREPGWVLEGRVAAGPDASPELARQLQYLGPPDANGRRPFSMAGTW